MPKMTFCYLRTVTHRCTGGWQNHAIWGKNHQFSRLNQGFFLASCWEVVYQIVTIPKQVRCDPGWNHHQWHGLFKHFLGMEKKSTLKGWQKKTQPVKKQISRWLPLLPPNSGGANLPSCSILPCCCLLSWNDLASPRFHPDTHRSKKWMNDAAQKKDGAQASCQETCFF